MKTRLFTLMALVLGMASCQRDMANVGSQSGDEVPVTLSVATPELGITRAGLDGEDDGVNGHDSAYGAIDYFSDADWDNKADLRYSLEVYDVTDLTEPIKDRMVKIVDKYESVKFELRLIPHREYQFVVFADFVPEGTADNEVDYNNQANLGLRHTIGANLTDIKVKEGVDAINDEIADAYFKTFSYEPTDNTQNNINDTEDVFLQRPYGKVRVVATDLAELNLNVEPRAVRVAYNAYHANAFNAVNGEISGEYVQEFYDFEYADLYKNVEDGGLAKHVYTEGYDARKADSKTGVKRHTHMTLFTDYILAENEQNSINFLMTVYDIRDIENATAENIIKTTAFNTDIPVQRNHLTTIIGNVLTAANEVTVKIDDNFANADNLEDDPFYVEVEL